MNSDLWWGAFLSIPIGIGTSLATPAIQRRIQSWSKTRDFERTKQTLAQYRKIESYVKNPHQLTQRLIMTTIQTASVSAFIVIMSTIVYGGANFMQFIGLSWFDAQPLYFMAQFITLVGGIVTVNILTPTIAIWRRVNNFDEYKTAVSKIISIPDDSLKNIDEVLKPERHEQ